MRKHVKFFLKFTIFMIIPAVSIAQTSTYIFQLSRSGNVIGKLGVESEQADFHTWSYHSVSAFKLKIKDLAYLGKLVGEKNITVNDSKDFTMSKLVHNNTVWEVSEDEEYIKIIRYKKKYEHQANKTVDDKVRINPVLPVYDMVSMLFAFQQNPDLKNFDFYLNEINHQKRKHIIKKDGGWEWFEDQKIADIRLNDKGFVELDFSDSSSGRLQDYKLLCCGKRSGGLYAENTVSGKEILDRYKRDLKQQVNLKAWSMTTTSATVDPERGISCEDCFSINQDVTESLRKAIMKNKKLENEIFAEKLLIKKSIFGRGYSLAFDPNMSMTFTKNDLSDRIKEDVSSYDLKSGGNTVILSYFKDELTSVPYSTSVKLSELFSEKKDIDYYEIEGDEKNITIKGFKKVKGFIFTNEEKVFEKSLDIGTFINRAQKNQLYTIYKNIRFDTSNYSLMNIGNTEADEVIISCDREIKESIPTSKRLSTLDIFDEEFGKEYDIEKKYIRAEIEELKGQKGFKVNYRLENDSVDHDWLEQQARMILPKDVTKDNIRLGFVHGRFYLKGNGSVRLNPVKIINMYKIPEDSTIDKNGNSLNFRYLDFACP